jgi:hypothetical protein
VGGQVLDGALAGHDGLDEESEHGEHSLRPNSPSTSVPGAIPRFTPTPIKKRQMERHVKIGGFSLLRKEKT